MLSLEERIAWLLVWIKKRDKITNIQLSSILDVDKNTIQAYCNGKGVVKGSVLSILVKNYDINGEWLLSGKSEPFPRAAEKFPEVCGPIGVTIEQRNQITASVKEQMAEAKQPPIKEGQEFRISDALTMCTRVLESGTSYATALYFNIEHFDRAVKSEFNNNKYLEDLKLVNDTLSKMQTRMDEAEQENKNLREDIRKLQGHSGDSAPIVLTMDHVARTGTDNQET